MLVAMGCPPEWAPNVFFFFAFSGTNFTRDGAHAKGRLRRAINDDASSMPLENVD
jgi:hypothetical protein